MTDAPLVGHQAQRDELRIACEGGRLHHAWLLTGQKGIGKAHFAMQAARALLTGATPFGAEGAAVDGFSARLFAAGTHPDFQQLERPVDSKTGRVGPQILVDQIRQMIARCHIKPSLSPFRVILVDSVDDFRHEGVNAFLKFLEEPPPGAFLFLVSHAPARLPQTLRSRCRVLRFHPLSAAQVDEILCREQPELSPSERAVLVQVAGGRPGRALRFSGLGVEELQGGIERLISQKDAFFAHDLASCLGEKGAEDRFLAFMELALDHMSFAARQSGGGNIPDLWTQALDLSGKAIPLSLDSRSVAYEIMGLLMQLPATCLPHAPAR